MGIAGTNEGREDFATRWEMIGRKLCSEMGEKINAYLGSAHVVSCLVFNAFSSSFAVSNSSVNHSA